jgi:hypothetical protein
MVKKGSVVRLEQMIPILSLIGIYYPPKNICLLAILIILGQLQVHLLPESNLPGNNLLRVTLFL